MIKRYTYIFFLGLQILSCKQEDVIVMPIKYQSSNFMTESAKRNRSILESEKYQINEYLKESTIAFFQNSEGIWISENSKNKSNRASDFVEYELQIKDLNNQILSSFEENGYQQAILEKTFVKQALQSALYYVNEKDTTVIISPSLLAYGFKGDGKSIHINQPIIYQIVPKRIEPKD